MAELNLGKVEGKSAGFGTVQASVSNTVGIPSVTVETSGTNEAKNFNFKFRNLKGEKGDPGAKGDKGDKGDPGEPGQSGSAADVETAEITFTEATTRQNIQSGETVKTLFGKIKKYFSDLKIVAFTADYNDLENTPEIPEGFDPSVLQNQIDSLQLQLNDISAAVGDGIPPIVLGACKNIVAKSTWDGINITWIDPDNVYLGGTLMAVWGGTKLLRKVDSYPASITDGTLIADIKIKNEYETEPLIDTNVTDGTIYKYMLFPYTTKENYAVNPDNAFSIEKKGISPILSENEWDVIAEMCEAEKASELWNVGDVAQLTLKGIDGQNWNTEKTVNVKLISFNADYLTPDTEGEATPKVLFWIMDDVLDNTLHTFFGSLATGTSSGNYKYANSNWENGDREKALERFPDILKSRMKKCKVMAMTGQNSSYVDSREETLYLPSSKELSVSGNFGTGGNKEGNFNPYFDTNEKRLLGNKWLGRTVSVVSGGSNTSSTYIDTTGALRSSGSARATGWYCPFFAL